MAGLLLATLALVAALLSSPPSAHAFYLPGSYPHKYAPGESLNVKVNSLTSINTEIPFRYYSLPFCAQPEGPKASAENLGELLMGDRIEISPYRFRMHANESDTFLCRAAPLSPAAFLCLATPNHRCVTSEDADEQRLPLALRTPRLRRKLKDGPPGRDVNNTADEGRLVAVGRRGFSGGCGHARELRGGRRPGVHHHLPRLDDCFTRMK